MWTTYGSKSGLQEVTHGSGRSLGLGVHILDTSELQETLGCGGSNDTSSTGGGNESAHDGANLSANLRGHGVGFTESSTPVASSDGNDGELGKDDGTTDSGGDFLCALDTETDMALRVTNGNESLEACALTGARLLLNGHDLHDLILKLGEEGIDDLVFLDGQREEVDFLHRLDLSILHKTAELGDGFPAEI